MKKLPQKKSEPHGKAPVKTGGKQFFTAPEKKLTGAEAVPDFRVRLGGIPLENKAGFELISLRLRQLLRNTPKVWEEIDREEHGSFWSIFRKYHLPLLMPFGFFFIVRELVRYVNLTLFLRHCLIMLPAFVAVYAGYIFLLGIIAEETAEYSGGRFAPQSGMRIALFSSLIISFLSIAVFIPVVGAPLLLLGFFWHYRQLFAGARALLNISENHYKLYRLSHLLVWALMGLAAFVALSVVSFISAKLGLVAI